MWKITFIIILVIIAIYPILHGADVAINKNALTIEFDLLDIDKDDHYDICRVEFQNISDHPISFALPSALKEENNVAYPYICLEVKDSRELLIFGYIGDKNFEMLNQKVQLKSQEKILRDFSLQEFVGWGPCGPANIKYNFKDMFSNTPHSEEKVVSFCYILTADEDMIKVDKKYLLEKLFSRPTQRPSTPETQTGEMTEK